MIGILIVELPTPPLADSFPQTALYKKSVRSLYSLSKAHFVELIYLNFSAPKDSQ